MIRYAFSAALCLLLVILAVPSGAIEQQSQVGVPGPFTDLVCPAATPLGRKLDIVLRAKPRDDGAYAELVSQLETAYADCVGEYRLKDDTLRLHWSLFRQAKLRLLMGDVAFEKKDLKLARNDYQMAYDLSNEIASYQGAKLWVSGSNRVGSQIATLNPFPARSEFKEIATDLRTIARASLDMIARH